MKDSTIRKAELVAATLLTVEAIWLRVIAGTSAGALWRDEANTVGLATLPTIRKVWENLQFDSFPMLWLLIVRAFSEVAGPANDPAFRALGLAIGLGIVGALWFYARSLHYSFPLISLALVALTPSIIVWGDSLRGYGLGILVIIVFAALIWRFIEAPTPARFALAAAVAVLSVQILYYNAVLLLAFCSGAGAVAARKRAWKIVALVGVIGSLAAFSLLPYAEAIREAGAWNVVFRTHEFTLQRFLLDLYLTLVPAGPWQLALWTEFLVLAVVAAAWAIGSSGRVRHSPAQRDVALFCVMAIVVGFTGIFAFLRTLSYPTNPWYYITLLALSGLCIDSISGSLLRSELARVLRLGGVILLGIMTFRPALHASELRRTNVDLVASRVQSVATRNDLIVISTWYYGITWNRYYRGATPWVTVPPLSFHRWHRPDLIKTYMMEEDQTAPVRPVASQIAATLRAGNRVFIVGNLPTVPPGMKPVILPRAPLHGEWPAWLYDRHWALTLGYFVQQHSTKRTEARVNPAGRVSGYEDLPLAIVTGWKP